MNQTTSQRTVYCPIFEKSDGNRFILLLPDFLCKTEPLAVAAAARAEAIGFSASGDFRFTGEVYVAGQARWYGPMLKVSMGPYPALVIAGPLWDEAVAKKLAAQTG